MIHIVVTVVVIISAAALVSCEHQPRPGQEQPPSSAVTPPAIEGTITQLSSGHGNAYTSIAPDQYEARELVAGRQIRVVFEDTELTMVIGQDYTDVPSGTPVAVLHREGLTFAIRDGNFSQPHDIAVGDTFRIYR